MQMAIVEFARDVAGFKDANSAELNPDTMHPVIYLMPEQNGVENIGGTLRLGAYPCVLKREQKHMNYMAPKRSPNATDTVTK